MFVAYSDEHNPQKRFYVILLQSSCTYLLIYDSSSPVFTWRKLSTGKYKQRLKRTSSYNQRRTT